MTTVDIQSRHTIPGRGLVIVVKTDYPGEVRIGDTVQDEEGRRYGVVGVEYMKKLLHPPVVSNVIGLVVRQQEGT